MNAYREAIERATECSDDDAARVEVLLRWWYGTLDALSALELSDAAIAHHEILLNYRCEARVDDEQGRLARMTLEQIDLEAVACA
jgi:hypothetical protein